MTRQKEKLRTKIYHIFFKITKKMCILQTTFVYMYLFICIFTETNLIFCKLKIIFMNVFFEYLEMIKKVYPVVIFFSSFRIINRVYHRLIMTDKAKGLLDTFNIWKYCITFSTYVCRTVDLFQICQR